jgi:hypothetical protein
LCRARKKCREKWAIAWEANQAGRTLIKRPRPIPRCSKPASLNNLPRINQRREVEADNIHLQFDPIVVLNHGANNGILDFTVMQVHADIVTDFELPAVWLLC